MTRNKIKIERIADESKRITTFKNHVERLSEKAEELSVLCGAEVGFVIHTEAENNAVLWPSPEVFKERMDKFLSFSEVERGKKMAQHDKYLEQQLDEVKKHTNKHHNSSDVIESRMLMNELVVSGRQLEGFDLREMRILRQFANKRMELIEASDELGINNNDPFVPVAEDPYAQIDATADDRETMDPQYGDRLN